MTRAEKADRRLRIRQDYSRGLTAVELSELYGLTEAYVYTICKGLTNPVNNKGYALILRDNAEDVIGLRQSGLQIRDIAAKYNVSIHSVKDFLKTNEIKLHEWKNSEEEAARRIWDKTEGQFIYVSGYTNKEGSVKVRCSDCGETFERTYHHLTTRRNNCPCCVRNAREDARAKKEADKELKAERRQAAREEREAERVRIRLERIHPCPVCGQLTDRKKYCSDKCGQKVFNQRGELRRRNLLKSAMIDKDITVDGLYRRDGGICAICGKPCNFEDYTVKDGYKICGDWYPSVDHVIPLAKGGLHSWDNVQLAHRRCNWEKSDSI